MGTIQLHISDTNWLVRAIEDRGINSNVTLYVDGPLAQSMAFFSSHYMVYLLGGVEPFRTDVSQVITVEAAQFMGAHIGFMIQRLDTDISMAQSLALSLDELSTTLEKIEHRISLCAAENSKVKIGLPSMSVWELFSRKTRIERKLSEYELHQQRVLISRRPEHFCMRLLKGSAQCAMLVSISRIGLKQRGEPLCADGSQNGSSSKRRHSLKVLMTWNPTSRTSSSKR